jgi:DNA repair exonuclease SbcCD nuclease subunit
MNNYKQCEHGLSYVNLFNKCNFVVSGHFHKKDHKEYENGQIVYLGSPYQQNFGDILEKRGIYVFDLEKNTFNFIENNISPKFFKISLKKLKQKKYNENELKDIIFKNFISLTIDEDIDADEILNYTTLISTYEPLEFKIDYEIINLTDKNDSFNAEYDNKNLINDMEEYVLGLDVEHKKEVVEYLKVAYNSLV